MFRSCVLSSVSSSQWMQSHGQHAQYVLLIARDVKSMSRIVMHFWAWLCANEKFPCSDAFLRWPSHTIQPSMNLFNKKQRIDEHYYCDITLGHMQELWRGFYIHLILQGWSLSQMGMLRDQSIKLRLINIKWCTTIMFFVLIWIISKKTCIWTILSNNLQLGSAWHHGRRQIWTPTCYRSNQPHQPQTTTAMRWRVREVPRLPEEEGGTL